jgi:O-antigen/teichoic acid export membrane protein
MNGIQIFIFIFIMWVMIIAGGGILVSIIAPVSIQGFGKYDDFFDSGIKAVIAILLVVTWIFIMSKIKNWIFQKQMKH